MNKKKIFLIILFCILGLLLYYQLPFHRPIDIPLENANVSATQKNFTQENTFVICKDNTLKNFPIFWGGRVELYSIPENKSYIITDNKKLWQTVSDPVSICGEYIYYEESGELTEGDGLCRVNIFNGEKEKIGIYYENYVIDEKKDIMYYNSYLSEENEYDTVANIFCMDLKNGKKEKILSFPVENDGGNYFDVFDLMQGDLIFHQPGKQEIILYDPDENKTEKITLLQKNEEVWDVACKDEDTMIIFSEKSGLFSYDRNADKREVFLSASEINMDQLKNIRYSQIGYKDGKVIYYDGEAVLYSYDIEADQTEKLFDVKSEKKADMYPIEVSYCTDYIVIKAEYSAGNGYEEWIYIVDYEGNLYEKMKS